jgi:hypothetical protein
LEGLFAFCFTVVTETVIESYASCSLSLNHFSILFWFLLLIDRCNPMEVCCVHCFPHLFISFVSSSAAVRFRVIVVIIAIMGGVGGCAVGL